MVPGPRPSDEFGGPAFTGGGAAPAADRGPRVALTRTARGWVVIPVTGCPAGELGGLPEPDRDARRSARGPSGAPADVDPVDARVAALERTVTQLEHALAARVSTERAIGVLAERNRCSPRAAFEELRRQARTQARPVVELAREVLDGLAADEPARRAASPAPVVVPGSMLRPQTAPQDVIAAADGRS